MEKRQNIGVIYRISPHQSNSIEIRKDKAKAMYEIKIDLLHKKSHPNILEGFFYD